MQTVKRVGQLKAEGAQCFAQGNFTKALEVYADAIKLLPGSAQEKAEFYNNKAACFIGLKR